MRYDGWRQVKLSDVGVKVIDGDRGKNYPNVNDFSDTGYCLFLNAKNVTTSGFSFEQKMFISEEKDLALRKGKLCRLDVVLTTRGTVGNVAFYSKDVLFDNIRINSGMVILRPNINELDSQYLYYLFRSSIIQNQIAQLRTGSAQPQLPIAVMYNLRFLLPPLVKQKAIAETLSCLDDKIELNNHINKNLEAQAQAIFKSWFVDFEPFQKGEFVDSELGKIPKGWEVCSLSVACSLIARGITPKYTEEGSQIILNQKCIREHQVGLTAARYHIPKKINEKWLQYGDILVNSTGKGTLGRTAQWYEEEINITVDSHVTIVRPKEPTLLYYLGQFIMGKEFEIESMASGSTGQTELSRERLGSLRVIIPNSKPLEDFSAIIEPLMKKITTNNKETIQLVALRDTLLPKLMSGEIQIPQEV